MVHIQYDDHGHIANRIKDFTRIIILTTHYAYLEQEHRWGNWINIFNYALNLPENAYIFCLSEGIKNVYINHRINPDKIIVIHNGVREDLMKYKENPIYPDKSVYVGKIEQRKRQNLIKDNQSIDFVGNIQDRYFTSSDKNYLGEWNRKTLYKNLTSYSNLVLISDGEADPLVVKEALVAGLGLVLSKVSTANLDLSKPFIDVITENKIHDIDYVNKVIEENRIKSLKYRSDIRQYGLEKFSWENIILEKYIPSIYKLLE